jgi:integrase
LPDEIKPVVTFAYWTACRRGEILSLRWSQLDLRQGVGRLEPGETKNDEGRLIPLAGGTPRNGPYAKEHPRPEVAGVPLGFLPQRKTHQNLYGRMGNRLHRSRTFSERGWSRDPYAFISRSSTDKSTQPSAGWCPRARCHGDQRTQAPVGVRPVQHCFRTGSA